MYFPFFGIFPLSFYFLTLLNFDTAFEPTVRPPSQKSKTRLIVGIIVGVVGIVFLLLLAVFFIIRRRRRPQADDDRK